jgi:hypothetical protein
MTTTTKPTKATKTEINQRIDEVLRIRLDGALAHDVQAYAAEKGWGLSERQVFRYIAKADALMAKRLEQDREKNFARHIQSRRTLYARCVNAADYSTALRVLDSEAELLGLFPEKKPTPPAGNLHVNLFERVTVLAQQLAERAVDRGLPAGLIPGNRCEESLDQTRADAEAERFPLAR